MQFLFPVFLTAGLALLIPVLIHLFNLRRYKKVLFPHTRFLQQVQLHSRRQSKLRYKGLLVLRLLFLVFLVLAFAQPFTGRKGAGLKGKTLQVVYIDNSYSMSVKDGQLSLLDRARQQAAALISGMQGGVVLLTNEHAAEYRPVPAAKALEQLAALDFAPVSRTNLQVIETVTQLIHDNDADAADLYYLSDMQQQSFKPFADRKWTEHIRFNGLLVQHEAPQNISIDTAYLDMPALQDGQDNRLIVRSRYYGKRPEAGTHLQLFVNGQLKSVASPVFKEGEDRYDTLSFQLSRSGWQQMLLTISDASVHFDDTFLIAGRNAPDLSVLVLNQAQSNAYIQAALRAYSGFKAEERQLPDLPQDLSAYNLILLNGVQGLDKSLAGRLAAALQEGQHVCIFPGRDADPTALNEGLQQLADIRITGIDTSLQTVSTLQAQHPLVRDLFEQVPANIQLPVVRQHYRISAGLSANQQSVFSFRNGDPFFTVFGTGAGSLYLCAAAADMESSNFPASYFFVPFLYQMASQSRGNDLYAIQAGQQAPVFVRNQLRDARARVHITGNGLDAIPPQRAEGKGIYVYAGNTVQRPGYYILGSGGADTTEIAVNAARSESDLRQWSRKELEQNWQGKQISFREVSAESLAGKAFQQDSFPLWKLCTILALSMLALESVLLAKKITEKKTITT